MTVSSEQLFANASKRLEAMQVEEAIQLFQRAQRNGHDADACSAGRWTCHMLAGRFECAWQESDEISRRGGPDPHRYWDGQSFQGRRVLVRCLHGLGDTIQFIRYAPLIREQAAFLAIEAQPSLKRLLIESRLADEVLTWGEAEPPWDQQVEVVELPKIFRTTLGTIPRNVPYLSGSQKQPLPREEATPLRVGLVWASSSYNPARSIPIEQLARLFSLPGAHFFSLQAGPEREQITRWSADIPSLYDESACALATADNLMRLDLVITVDTMMAHLAGALARPVWTLLPYECDWRWMLQREDSPWYPTMRLFRQPASGDWGSVLERVRTELAVLSTSKPRSQALLQQFAPASPHPDLEA